MPTLIARGTSSGDSDGDFVHNSAEGKHVAICYRRRALILREISVSGLVLLILNGVATNHSTSIIHYSYPERGVRSKVAVRGKSGSSLVACHLPTY